MIKQQLMLAYKYKCVQSSAQVSRNNRSSRSRSSSSSNNSAAIVPLVVVAPAPAVIVKLTFQE